MAELSEVEAAVYDRQLRVWGIEVQKRYVGPGRYLVLHAVIRQSFFSGQSVLSLFLAD